MSVFKDWFSRPLHDQWHFCTWDDSSKVIIKIELRKLAAVPVRTGTSFAFEPDVNGKTVRVAELQIGRGAPG